MNNLNLQRIKLYNKLNIELSINHIQPICCDIHLTNEEMLRETFSLRCSLSETEECTLYYIYYFQGK